MAVQDQTAEEIPEPESDQGMFPIASLDSTVSMITDRRKAAAEAQERAQAEADRINRLTSEIQVLNSLRQAHGQQPI